ncbi:MAG: DUF4271 domain-containing protein [Saprospiraceae bacterium]
MKWLLVVSSIFFVHLAEKSSAQTTNPFEIASRKPVNASALSKEDSMRQQVNPFELIEASEIPKTQVTPSSSWLSTSINNYLDLRSDPAQIKTMLFWLLLFLIFLLAIAVNLNRGLIAKLYKANTNLNLFNMLYRENKEENRLIFPLLYGLYFAGISIFLYLSIINRVESNYSMLLIVLTIVVMGVYIIRHLSLKLLSSIFNIGKEVDHYLFNIVCFGSMMAIIFIPLDFIIAFSKPSWAQKIVTLGFIFFGITYVFRQIKEILASSNLWSRSIIHFLLYLCSFEIAPLVFLYIYLQRQGWV